MKYFIIILAAILLLILVAAGVCRIFSGKKDKSPGSPAYSIFFLLLKAVFFRMNKPEFDDKLMDEVSLPYILLVNHESYEDFYYVWQMVKKDRPNILVNEYYTRIPFLHFIAVHGGALTKKIFTKEMKTGMGIYRMLKKGYPVIIFPEGRLSPDGRTTRIAESGAGLYRRMKFDVVLVRVEGSYYAHPKWRKKYYKSKVKVSVKRVIHREELKRMTDEELESVIYHTLGNDAADYELFRYPQKDKAKGLEGVLFRCVFCNTKYRTMGKGNELICNACCKKLTLDERYHFTEWPYTISGYYEAISEAEKKELGDLQLQMDVKLKVIGKNGFIVKKESGECRMNINSFSYRSETEEFDIPVRDLPGLAYSCKKEIELYRGENQYFFYPKSDAVQVAEWALFIDLTAGKEVDLIESER